MNPFATGIQVPVTRLSKEQRRAREEDAPRIVGRIAKMKTKKEDSAWRDARADPMKGKERRGEKESKGRQKSGQAERRGDGPGLVIYIESYLHLNVFIFNARPRNGPSALSGFVSAPHLCTPSHMLPPSLALCFSPLL